MAESIAATPSQSLEAPKSTLADRIPWKWLQLGVLVPGSAGLLGYGLSLAHEGWQSPRFDFASSLFTASAFCYLFAFFGYLVHLGRGRELSARTASLITLGGAVAHTAAMILRWTISGWAQPPWTNLYESLLFFAWGVAVVYLVFEWRANNRSAGVFVIPVAMLLMGLAALTPETSKDIPQIMPALQSRWIQIHVTFATFAYAAFFTAAGFALLYLIKERVSVGFMASVFGCFAAFTFFLPGWGDVLLYAEYPLKAPQLIPTGELVKFPRPVPWAGPIFLVTTLLYLATPLLYHLGKRGVAAAGQYARLAFIGAFIAHGIGMGLAFWWATTTPAVEWRPGMPEMMKEMIAGMTMLKYDINAYRLALVVLVWLGSLVLLVVDWKGADLAARLPKSRSLDEWSYRAILVGLPLMTLNLITGAIWANNAWGSYWSWDPKETWALITWLVYAAYIHTRIVGGWKGRKSAALAVAGFAVVIFTYLGVNLFLSGLHSYGAPS